MCISLTYIQDLSDMGKAQTSDSPYLLHGPQLWEKAPLVISSEHVVSSKYAVNAISCDFAYNWSFILLFLIIQIFT